MQAREALTQEQLKTVLHYDPETGAFTRIGRASGLGPNQIGRQVGSDNGRGYLIARVYGRHYLLSRLAWLYMKGAHPSGEIDHIDRNRSNNKWGNLRDVSRSENCRNMRAKEGKSSQFRGVSKRGNRWQVVVRVDGRLRFLGTYDSEHAAAAVAAPHFAGIAP